MTRLRRPSDAGKKKDCKLVEKKKERKKERKKENKRVKFKGFLSLW